MKIEHMGSEFVADLIGDSVSQYLAFLGFEMENPTDARVEAWTIGTDLIVKLRDGSKVRNFHVSVKELIS